MSAFTPNRIRKFWKKVLKREDSECWGWVGSKSHGYGYMYVGPDRNPMSANRVSWIIHNGDIPDGMYVLHRCDNRECTNPNHLFLGTHRENISDMVKKGRQNKGEDSIHAKLTEEKVLLIRSLCAQKSHTRRDIALKFGVSQGTIGDVLHKSWRHLK